LKITALLADAVAVAESRLYVQGGGWHVVQSAQLPAVLPNLGVGMIIDFAAGELAHRRRFALRIRDAAGRLIPLVHENSNDQHSARESEEIAGELPAAPPGAEAAAVTLVLAFNVQQVTLDQVTPYELEIAIDEEVRERLPLEVRLVQPDAG
jgi:hypothetical protein